MAPKKATSNTQKKRKATEGASSSQPPQPIRQNHPSMNPRFIPIFENLKKRSFHATRFYDRPACRALGLNGSFENLLRRIHWGSFIRNSYPTYQLLTCEFLATLERQEIDLDEQLHRVPQATISFSLFGTPHSIPLEELNRIFGWDVNAKNHNPIAFPGSDFNLSSWWMSITGNPLPASRSRYTSHIVSPHLRILSRLFHQILSSKGEFHKMSTEDLILLYTAIHPGHEDFRINFGWFFTSVCKKIKEEQSDAPIFLGGMVTWLAHSLGHAAQCAALPIECADRTMTLATLKHYKFIIEGQERDTFEWRVNGQFYITLPNDRTDLDEEFRYWTFDREQEASDSSSDDDGAPQPPPAQPYPGYYPPPPPPMTQPRPSTFEEGGSSSAPPFNPYSAFPPHYFGDSSAPPPPPPRDPYDLSPMYHMLGQLHRRMDETSRVVWHDHTHLVNAGFVPGFANHPAYPPDFDSPFLPLQPQPGYYPPGHPFFRPPPPQE